MLRVDSSKNLLDTWSASLHTVHVSGIKLLSPVLDLYDVLFLREGAKSTVGISYGDIERWHRLAGAGLALRTLPTCSCPYGSASTTPAGLSAAEAARKADPNLRHLAPLEAVL